MSNRNLTPATFPAPPPPPQQMYDVPTAPIEYKFDPSNMQFTPMHEPAYPVMDFKPKPSMREQYEMMAADTQESMGYQSTSDMMYHHHPQQHENEQMPVYTYAPTPQFIAKQEPQMSMNEMESEPQESRPLQDDLAISDSDEEQGVLRMDTLKQEQTNNDDDGEGLWF